MQPYCPERVLAGVECLPSGNGRGFQAVYVILYDVIVYIDIPYYSMYGLGRVRVAPTGELKQETHNN